MVKYKARYKMSDEDKREELILATNYIKNYCSETKCENCIIEKLCNALNSNELPLSEQIMRVVENEIIRYGKILSLMER